MRAPAEPLPAGHSVLLWILRAGVALEFVGHGMVGIAHPPAWAAYFAVLGIGRETAFRLMPFVGGLDILIGLSILVRPLRPLVWYTAVWAVWTALLRPLAGEPVWETIERAGNFGVPLALAFALSPRAQLGHWVAPVLRLTTALLLIGHGALGLLVHKALFLKHYAAVGLPGPALEPWVGGCEMFLGFAVLFAPFGWLLLAIFGWKLASELLNPIAGSSIWVFVEHGGSYAAPLALWYLQKQHARLGDQARRAGGDSKPAAI